MQVVLSGRFFPRASDDAFGVIRPQQHRIMCDHLQYRLTNTQTRGKLICSHRRDSKSSLLFMLQLMLTLILFALRLTHRHAHNHPLFILPSSSAHSLRMFIAQSGFPFFWGYVCCAVR